MRELYGYKVTRANITKYYTIYKVFNKDIYYVITNGLDTPPYDCLGLKKEDYFNKLINKYNAVKKEGNLYFISLKDARNLIDWLESLILAKYHL